MNYLRISLQLTALVFLFTACTIEPKKKVPLEYQAGQKEFHRVCAGCHGADALGGWGKAPKLIQKKFIQENYSNRKIASTILKGSSSGAMPSQKNRVSDQTIKEIIKYIRYSQAQSGISN